MKNSVKICRSRGLDAGSCFGICAHARSRLGEPLSRLFFAGRVALFVLFARVGKVGNEAGRHERAVGRRGVPALAVGVNL